jgi:GrpB-like predicted nucleotidyltransferase (UPF0157 family)
MRVEIADYDPAWPATFEAEKVRLREALGEIAQRIDHVGSTAVLGLAARPVIDIQVSVAREQPIDDYRERLEGIGYTFTIFPVAYFYRPEAWPHTYHVHVREAGGFDERRILSFRDWLRVHPEDCKAYEALKRELASRSDADSADGRARYSEAKTDFIRSIEGRATE